MGLIPNQGGIPLWARNDIWERFHQPVMRCRRPRRGEIDEMTKSAVRDRRYSPVSDRRKVAPTFRSAHGEDYEMPT